MRKRYVSIAISTFFLFGSLIMLIPGTEAHDEVTDSQISFLDLHTENSTKLDMSGPNGIMLGMDGQYTDGQKTAGIKIEDLRISPMVNNRIFPNTVTDYTVITSGNPPYKATLTIDNDRPNIEVAFDMDTLKFSLSEDAVEFITLLNEGSKVHFNSSSFLWEIHFVLKIDWKFSTPGYMDYKVVVDNGAESRDIWYVESGYFFETGIVFDGEPKLRTIVPGELSSEGYIRGGAQAIMSGVSLHFKQASQIAPSPEDVRLAIVDQNNRSWEYKPYDRKDLLSISFSFSIPIIDEDIVLEMRIIEKPDNCDVGGEIKKHLTIDSTSPLLTRMMCNLDNEKVELSWDLEEYGSGVNLQSMTYTLKDYNGNVLVTDKKPESVSVHEGWITIKLYDLSDGEFQIIPEIEDNVRNVNDDRSFKFSTIIRPLHDLSIDPVISYYPENIVQDRPVSFTVAVHNVGTEDEYDVQIEVMKGDFLFDRIMVDKIPAGTSTDIIWVWLATEKDEVFTAIVDPYNSIGDEDLSNNNANIKVNTQFIDISIIGLETEITDPDYDIITFGIELLIVGDIGEKPIRAVLIQDGQSIRLYSVPEHDENGLSYLEIDWVRNDDISVISIVIDPFNEIIESYEDNNRIDVDNPFIDHSNEQVEKPDEKEISISDEDPIENSDIQVPNENMGGITVIGPEIPPYRPDEVIIREEPQSGDRTDDDDMAIDPLAIPIIITTTGIIVLLSLAFSFTRESVKFKIMTLMIPLYSKLKKEKLEQGIRYEILGYLRAKPGANYTELKNNLDLNDGSLVHHLKILEREEMIYSKKMGKYKLFYIFSYRRKATIGSYLTPFHRRLMELIEIEPGIIPKKLARILDRSQPDISYHLSELTRNGFLEKKKKGRNIHYYIREEYRDILSA